MAQENLYWTVRLEEWPIWACECRWWSKICSSGWEAKNKTQKRVSERINLVQVNLNWFNFCNLQSCSNLYSNKFRKNLLFMPLFFCVHGRNGVKLASFLLHWGVQVTAALCFCNGVCSCWSREMVESCIGAVCPPTLSGQQQSRNMFCRYCTIWLPMNGSALSSSSLFKRQLFGPQLAATYYIRALWVVCDTVWLPMNWHALTL